MNGHDIVANYVSRHYRIVTWAAIGDAKGPREKDWPHKEYTIEDYHEGNRIGLITGIEVEPGKFLHDVDLDWAAGSSIAQSILPPTNFVFGRPSKSISHCFYTTSEPLPSYRYEDIDKTVLIELRGTKINGDVGLQTMAPPSIWSKGTQREPLSFVRYGDPSHIAVSTELRQATSLAAIAMILAKHLGKNGFGHEPRLAWAGFLLRAGIKIDDLVKMGEAISTYCTNLEISDVRRVLESTAAALNADAKKVKGGLTLARILGLNGKAVLARINEWLGRDSDFVRDQQGRILPKHLGNVRRAIELLGHELSYNEFAEKRLMDGLPMQDAQRNALYFDIETECRFQPPPEYFKEAVDDIAWRNKFHPVKNYLDGLQWDGLPRIDEWLILAGSAIDTPYVRAISSIMLIAGVRRIRHPGCKYDEMVVWESPQGTNKSSAAQALCPVSEWFSDDLRLNLQSKELIEATLGKWIIEASDLAGKRKAEIEQLKAMLSRQSDGPARMAYARLPVERSRQFILVGTTNSSAYLTDPTGGRRFWPIKVKRFHVDWIREHRDQMWAEACHREAKGESIRLPEELWPDAVKEQEKRREMDPWEQALRSYLITVDTEPSSDGINKRRVTSSALWQALNMPIERRDRVGALRMADIMQRLGFRRTTVRDAGHVVAGYVTEKDGILELEDGSHEG